MTNISAEFDKLQDDIDKQIRTVTSALYTELEMKTPVDTGYLKNSWEAEEIKKLHWRISNNSDYADYALMGRRMLGEKTVGSEQLPDGISPILIKYDEELENRLKGLKR